MINAPRVPELVNPELLDAALLPLQQLLADRLSWLDFAFGQAQKLIEKKDGNVEYFPGVYVGGSDYRSVFPNDQIGNFSFFDKYEGHKLSGRPGRPILEAKVGLVVWFDLSNIFPNDWQQQSPENVKYQVLHALRPPTPQSVEFQLLQVYDTAKKMFPGYRDKEISSQFLVRPYGGFRIDLDIKYQPGNNC